MTSNAPLRVGVIGVGFGATVHVPGFLSEGWQVPVVWGRRIELAREKAAALGVPDVAEDWRDIVARDDLDAVAITTPPAAHFEMVTAALRAGKHVLCEKPFALNVREARGMGDLARELGRTAMVAHEFRFAPQRAQIKDLLNEGRIGTPELVSAELLMGRPRPDTPPPHTWAADASQGGGLLGALGSHYIDGFRHWFGDVISASGVLTTRNPDRTDAAGEIVQADSDDTFAITLMFESGVDVSMTASSQVSPSLGARITIVGSEGVLVATQRGPNPDPDGVVLAGRAGDRELEALPVDPRYVPIEDDRDQRLAAFRLLVREFERGIREGYSPSPNFADATACQEVLDAVRAAALGGRTISVGGRPPGGRAALGETANRFDRFSERARQALTQAGIEAAKHEHETAEIGSEHLLMAIALEEDGVAAQTLRRLDLDADAIEGGLGARRAEAEVASLQRMSDDLKRTFERSVQSVHELQSGEIESAHLLIGIIDAGGSGAALLARLGTDVAALRAALIEELSRS